MCLVKLTSCSLDHLNPFYVAFVSVCPRGRFSFDIQDKDKEVWFVLGPLLVLLAFVLQITSSLPLVQFCAC